MNREHTGTTRRNFLKTVGAVGTGSLLSAAVVGAAREADRQGPAAFAPDTTPDQRLETPLRPFGRTGVNTPILALGGMFEVPTNQIVLQKALEWGVTYWDTANSYSGGRSESGMGRFFERNPDARKRIFLVTKSGNRAPADLDAHLRISLERLQTDYVDLFFIHAIRSIDEMSGDIRSWAEKAKKAGKIRFIGFSTHANMKECLLGAAKLGWIDGVMMTYNFRNMNTDPMQKAVDACFRAGIGLTAMKTQGAGPVRAYIENVVLTRLMDQSAREGNTEQQAKLIAVWSDERIASICSQMPNIAILKANVEAAVYREKLSGQSTRLLEQYARNTFSEYCAGCRDVCEPVMNGAPLGDIMRCLMYSNGYGDMEGARNLFHTIPARTRSSLAALDYAAAEQTCPRRLPIRRLVREAIAKFA